MAFLIPVGNCEREKKVVIFIERNVVEKEGLETVGRHHCCRRCVCVVELCIFSVIRLWSPSLYFPISLPSYSFMLFHYQKMSEDFCESNTHILHACKKIVIDSIHILLKFALFSLM